MKITPLLATLALALSLGLPATALAHPKLLSASPAANATVGATKRVTLNFSERLLPKLSGGELVMTGMPGMAAHGPMKVAVTSSRGASSRRAAIGSTGMSCRPTRIASPGASALRCAKC